MHTIHTLHGIPSTLSYSNLTPFPMFLFLSFCLSDSPLPRAPLFRRCNGIVVIFVVLSIANLALSPHYQRRLHSPTVPPSRWYSDQDF
ncbi:hypothetical protein M413DRAFT_444992 [Hebeloma cylindrosporum]|uniref:Uncharacterized protein n=1 Tax=Hebeloma cylindrosporum TaxID=76867 RepID=A0A0C3CDS4_HEBCY|nr:hypothetical protein M413DRAFT_444992 [Hebeloma cylindrosporum h7]